MAFAAKEYPINGKELKATDFERLPLIIPETGGQLGTIENLLHAIREAGCKPNIALRCESPEAIKSAVRNKLGVGILYKNALRDSSARRLFKQLYIRGFPLEGKTYVLYNKQGPLTAAGQEFLATVRAWCERHNHRNRTRS